VSAIISTTIELDGVTEINVRGDAASVRHADDPRHIHEWVAINLRTADGLTRVYLHATMAQVRDLAERLTVAAAEIEDACAEILAQQSLEQAA
jgi:hypothetical protein